MSYGRDYGNRNFLERAAHTVRGWIGGRGGYDDGYRGMDRGYDGGYREMGDVNGYRAGGWDGGMEHGFGAANWRGRNPDWDRGRGGMGGDWNRGYGAGARAGWGRGGEGYRTGGYNPGHGAWDVDWEDRTVPQGGMDRGWSGGGAPRGYDRGFVGRDHFEGRDFTHQGYYDHNDGYRDDLEPGMRGGMNRGGMGYTGGMMGSERSAAMNRGNRDWNRGGMDRGDWNRGAGQGYGAGMPGRDADLGDAGGGMIGNYGAYGSYGLERFRSGSAGGVPTGQYWTGYGHGSGYRG